MATSGSKSVAVTSYDTLKFSWNQSSQSIANNTTTISWKMQLISTKYGKISSTAKKSWSVTVNGKKYSGTNTVSIAASSTKTLKSGSTTISHDADGTKTFSYSFSQEFDMNFNGHVGTKSGKSTGTLETIPRAASITAAPDCNDEANPTITYSNPAGSAVTTLQACISLDTSTDDIKYRDISKTGTSYTFNLTDDERNTLRQACTTSNSRTVYFYVRTTIGTSKYYSKLARTLTIINASPTFKSSQLSYHDVNPEVTAITNNPLMMVQNKSNLQVQYTAATAKKYATISQYSFTLNGVTKISTSAGGTVDFGTVNSGTNLTLTVTATDSRGNTAQATKTITCYKYYTPSFINFKAYRSNDDGSDNLNGAYLRCDFSTNIADVNGTNKRTVSVIGVGNKPIIINGGSGVSNSVVVSTGNMAVIDLNGDTTNTYNVYAIVEDLYSGSTGRGISEKSNILGEARIINISPSGTGIALGKKSESDELFECRWPAKFLSTVSGPSGFSTSSDKRVKTNIKNLDIDIVDQLQSVQYQLIDSKDEKIHYGFIAQDVIQSLLDAGIDPALYGIVGTIQNGETQQYVLTYTEFIPLLVNKCQNLQQELNQLHQEIAEIKNLII